MVTLTIRRVGCDLTTLPRCTSHVGTLRLLAYWSGLSKLGWQQLLCSSTLWFVQIHGACACGFSINCMWEAWLRHYDVIARFPPPWRPSSQASSPSPVFRFPWWWIWKCEIKYDKTCTVYRFLIYEESYSSAWDSEQFAELVTLPRSTSRVETLSSLILPERPLGDISERRWRKLPPKKTDR